MKKINFKQPKYVLPAILYLPLIGLGWLVIDIFHTEIKEKPTGLQTTEYLNAELPGAKTKDIGSKRENMMKSFGAIRDETAVNIAGRDSVKMEEYETKYSDAEVDELAKQMAELEAEKQKALAEKAAKEEAERKLQEEREAAKKAARDKFSPDDKFKGLTNEAERLARQNTRQREMFEELERELGNTRGGSAEQVLAEYRRRYGALPGDPNADVPQDTVPAEKAKPKKKGGFYSSDTEAMEALDEDADENKVVKKRKGASSQFNTISSNEQESKMLRAMIDEEIKVVDGSRVRLRLLDDAEVNGITLKKGSYLYAIMSGFSKQRIQGKVESVMSGDELVKISLSVYDLDGLEGLYVPGSSFRETSKDVLGGAFQQSMQLSSGISTGEMLTNFAGQAIQNAYQKTSQAIAKAIKKNKVRLKYGTQIYLLNGKSQQQKKADAEKKAAAERAKMQQSDDAMNSSQQSALDRYRRSYNGGTGTRYTGSGGY